jgi:para-nitrobenzyl esterase
MEGSSEYAKMEGSGQDLEDGRRQAWPGVHKRIGIKGVFAVVLLVATSSAFWLGKQTASQINVPAAQELASISVEAKVKVLQFPLGPIVGLEGPAFGQVFRGIPYAKAKRFQRPMKPDPWAPDLLDCTKFRASCLRQGNADMSEDCLHLSVYTPLQISTDSHPVVVWFHGGSFTMGAGSDTTQEDVHDLVLTNRLIVVTINYRLGVFGFLGSEKLRGSVKHSTGNWGVLDQEMSLRWVQNHIKYFGGDPTRVTLLGWSAGAASISVHLVKESSRGLFSKAILMSGGFTDWAANDMANSEQLYNDTIHRVGCETDPLCLVAGPVCPCLQNMDGERLVNLQPGEGWAPTIDGVEVLYHPMEALEKGYVHAKLPIIIGGAYEDAMVDIGASASEDNFHQWLKQEKAPDNVAPAYMNADVRRGLYYGALGEARRGWSPAYWAVRSASADKDMNCPALKAAQLWEKASGAPAYWYLWEASAPNLAIPPPKHDQESKELSTGFCWPCPGAGHGADLPFLFEHSKLNVDDNVAELSDMHQALFTDFIKTGNPNDWNGLFFATATKRKDMSEEGVAWTTVSGGDGGMRFTPGGTEYVKGLKQDVCKLWGI